MAPTDAAADSEPQDIRPVVARRVSNRGVWVFAGFAALGAAGLFSALEARRTTISSPAISVLSGGSAAMISPPPELAIPPAWAQPAEAREVGLDQAAPANPREPALVPVQPSAPRSGFIARAAPAYSVPAQVLDSPASPLPPMPGYAYQAPQLKAPVAEASGSAPGDDKRVNASRFMNAATTVPQGTVIQAVMETALDSTRAGFARAIVSRDVSSFDGSRVLIPKGSKLFGEYKADLAHGQNRALIQWRRLTRPDGAIIDVDSPSADPLGRAGLNGKVNSHFLARFGGAILQSVLDIGVQVAAQNVSRDTLILNLPNSVNAPVVQRPEDVRPTLTVRQGATVSVFVGRDLDFTSVEQ